MSTLNLGYPIILSQVVFQFETWSNVTVSEDRIVQGSITADPTTSTIWRLARRLWPYTGVLLEKLHNLPFWLVLRRVSRKMSGKHQQSANENALWAASLFQTSNLFGGADWTLFWPLEINQQPQRTTRRKNRDTSCWWTNLCLYYTHRATKDYNTNEWFLACSLWTQSWEQSI